MTAPTAAGQAQAQAQAAPRPHASFAHLLDTEARHAVHLPAGFWLLTGALASLVLGTITVLTLGAPGKASPAAFLLDAAYPLALALPLVAIVLVTSEPGARADGAGDHPARVLGAKALVSAAIAVGLPLLAVALAALGALASAATQGIDAVWDVTAGQHLRLTLFALVTMATAFCAALATRRVPTAVAAYLVAFAGLPALAAVVGTSPGSALPWVDLGSAAYALQGTTMPGPQWFHLATSSVLWLAAPAVFGLRRALRTRSSARA